MRDLRNRTVFIPTTERGMEAHSQLEVMSESWEEVDFHGEGPIKAKALDLLMTVLARGTKSLHYDLG